MGCELWQVRVGQDRRVPGQDREGLKTGGGATGRIPGGKVDFGLFLTDGREQVDDGTVGHEERETLEPGQVQQRTGVPRPRWGMMAIDLELLQAR